MENQKELYPLDKVGNVPDGIWLEFSDKSDFSYITYAMYAYRESNGSVRPFGYWELDKKGNKQNTSCAGFARHPIPKELTDEEIVGDGYVRLGSFDIRTKGYQWILKKDLHTGRWMNAGEDGSVDLTGEQLDSQDQCRYYYRAPKPQPLTDTERHEILLKNVCAGGCWVKHNLGNTDYNSWWSSANIGNYKIKLPNSTKYVEITDEVLRGLGK